PAVSLPPLTTRSSFSPYTTLFRSLDTERRQVSAVYQQTCPERVVRTRRGVAEGRRFLVGDDHPHALRVHELAGRERDQQEQQAEVEYDVAHLARIPALCGQLDAARHATVPVVATDPPALEALLDLVRSLLRRCRGPVRRMMRQACKVTRGKRRRGLELFDQINRPRRQAAHQRYKQQHIHGCEPPAGEHVEQLEL